MCSLCRQSNIQNASARESGIFRKNVWYTNGHVTRAATKALKLGTSSCTGTGTDTDSETGTDTGTGTGSGTGTGLCTVVDAGISTCTGGEDSGEDTELEPATVERYRLAKEASKA